MAERVRAAFPSPAAELVINKRLVVGRRRSSPPKSAGSLQLIIIGAQWSETAIAWRSEISKVQRQRQRFSGLLRLFSARAYQFIALVTHRVNELSRHARAHRLPDFLSCMSSLSYCTPYSMYLIVADKIWVQLMYIHMYISLIDTASCPFFFLPCKIKETTRTNTDTEESI